MSYVGKITDTASNVHLVGSTLYGTCSTGASTAAKVVTCADFDQLLTGVTIHVKFTNSNTASTPTLNVNGTGAKNIYKYGTTKPGTTAATSWYAGSVVSFTYDGSYWQMNDHIDDTTISNTDEKVKQTESTTDAEYEVIFAGSTGTTTKTEGVGKSEYFKYNPSKKAFTFGVRASESTVGNYSFAVGIGITASGARSHAEGFATTASGDQSHAEGSGTMASRNCSHAEGDSVTASGDYSHAEGYFTIANHQSQHVFGAYNIEDPSGTAATARGNYVEIVGNGTSSARSNARTLDWDGNEWLAGNLDLGGTSSDIVLSGTDNTWDGTNTSLKSAISSLNSRTMGIKQVVAGTKVVSTTALNYKQIFTNAEINTLLGVTGSSNGNIVVLVENGDYSAQPKYLGSVAYENGNYFVKPIDNSSFTVGNMRINYVIIRFA